METTLAIATAALPEGVHEDDRRLQAALQARGVDASVCVWSDPANDWSRFDAVIIRSTWDYFRRYPAFLAWLDHLDDRGVRVINDSSVVRWNADKHYLQSLSRLGIPVVPTEFAAAADVLAVVEALGDREVVVKPAVSGSAWNTMRGRARDAAFRAEAARLPREATYLVQPFLPEIASAGEWSLVYFGERLHHAVLKTPAAGDYRVQSEHGGLIRVATPDIRLQAAGRKVLDAARTLGMGATTYARVDGVVVDDDFLLMELELIEPNLFLTLADAVDPFADEVAAALADVLAG